MKTDLRAYHGAPLIPQVNLQVSAETYYKFLLAYRGGFTWNFEYSIKEATEIQKYFLNFLTENKVSMGVITFVIFCTRFGECESKEIRVSRIDKITGGWKLGDDY